jgi:hypothetical protein
MRVKNPLNYTSQHAFKDNHGFLTVEETDPRSPASLEISKSADLQKMTPILKNQQKYSHANRLKMKNSSKLSQLKERIEHFQNEMDAKQLMRMSLKDR